MDPAWEKAYWQRKGMIEVSDFDDEPRYRHPKRRVKKSRARSITRTPCPVAEDGKHVYVWEGTLDTWGNSGKELTFYRYFGYYKHERQVCCGCLTTKGSRRETQKYIQVKERKWRKLTGGEYGVVRGAPVKRYGRWGGSFYTFTWEDRHEGYREALAEWETTLEAKRMRDEAMRRRIEMRRKYLGLTN